MNTTIAVKRIVLIMASLTSAQVRRLCDQAKSIAPTAPMAPASVGVAMAVLMPGKPPMLPSTVKMRTADGTMPRRHFLQSAQPSKVRADFGIPGR